MVGFGNDFFYTVGWLHKRITLLANWKLNNKRTALPIFCFNLQFTMMCFHYIVAHRQTQTRALACWFGSKKRLEDLI
jgi:hypothetical protein